MKNDSEIEALFAGNNISGEIFTIDEKMLKTLDRLEQYPDWYDRQLHDVLVGSETVQCWIYMLKNYSENLLLLPFLTEFKERT